MRAFGWGGRCPTGPLKKVWKAVASRGLRPKMLASHAADGTGFALRSRSFRGSGETMRAVGRDPGRSLPPLFSNQMVQVFRRERE